MGMMGNCHGGGGDRWWDGGPPKIKIKPIRTIKYPHFDVPFAGQSTGHLALTLPTGMLYMGIVFEVCLEVPVARRWLPYITAKATTKNKKA